MDTGALNHYAIRTGENEVGPLQRCSSSALNHYAIRTGENEVGTLQQCSSSALNYYAIRTGENEVGPLQQCSSSALNHYAIRTGENEVGPLQQCSSSALYKDACCKNAKGAHALILCQFDFVFVICLAFLYDSSLKERLHVEPNPFLKYATTSTFG